MINNLLCDSLPPLRLCDKFCSLDPQHSNLSRMNPKCYGMSRIMSRMTSKKTLGKTVFVTLSRVKRGCPTPLLLLVINHNRPSHSGSRERRPGVTPFKLLTTHH
jgi:hypothetical protein